MYGKGIELYKLQQTHTRRRELCQVQMPRLSGRIDDALREMQGGWREIHMQKMRIHWSLDYMLCQVIMWEKSW
jgi:hypothetical protein